MDTQQFQGILNRIQTDVASNAKQWIPASQKLTVESVVSAAIVFAGFWIASILVRKLAAGFYRARKIDEALANFLQRVTRFLILSFGIVTVLGTLGVDVSAIVAGLGLTGLALGIALKDIVSNAVSGIMLLLFRPFRHRDHIKVADFEGTVQDIDLRYTHLHASGKKIYVPNSLLFANAVTVLKKAEAVIPEPQPEPTEETLPMPATRRANLLLSLASDEGDSFEQPAAA